MIGNHHWEGTRVSASHSKATSTSKFSSSILLRINEASPEKINYQLKTDREIPQHIPNAGTTEVSHEGRSTLSAATTRLASHDHTRKISREMVTQYFDDVVVNTSMVVSFSFSLCPAKK